MTKVGNDAYARSYLHRQGSLPATQVGLNSQQTTGHMRHARARSATQTVNKTARNFMSLCKIAWSLSAASDQAVWKVCERPVYIFMDALGTDTGLTSASFSHLAEYSSRKRQSGMDMPVVQSGCGHCTGKLRSATSCLTYVAKQSVQNVCLQSPVTCISSTS